MKALTTILVFSSLILIGCEIETPELDSQIQLFNAEDTKKLSTWLKQTGVEHQVDMQGTIWYNIKDFSKVDPLVELVVGKGKIYSNFIKIGDKKYREYFLEELEKAKIKYRIEQRDNLGEVIAWDEILNVKVGKAINLAWQRRKKDFSIE